MNKTLVPSAEKDGLVSKLLPVAPAAVVETSARFDKTNTGASFTGVTVSVNVSETLDVASLAVTLKSNEPLKSFGGTPENVRVAVLKLSQPGSGLPSPSVAA